MKININYKLNCNKMLVLLILFFDLCVGWCSDSVGCNCQNPPRCGNLASLCQCICYDGCNITNLDEDRICTNITQSIPRAKIIYPCEDVTNTKCFYNYNKTYCPNRCIYQNGNCKPLTTQVCYPHRTWVCPIGCAYNSVTHKCDPITQNSICGLVENTMICPRGCIYNSNFNKCMNRDQFTVCGLEHKLVCPNGCLLNFRGDLCIPADGYICNITHQLPCQNGYIPYNGYCIAPSNRNKGFYIAITEPFISLKCLHDVYLYGNTEITRSSIYSRQDDLGFFNNSLVYPLRLKDKYQNIVCKYSGSNCDSKFITRLCCP